MNTGLPWLGILGGTFDPLHHAHLKAAHYLLSHYPFDKIHFVPCKAPVLKEAANASSKHRLAMLRLGLKDKKGCVVDERELKRKSPSYTLETLQSFREEFPNRSLIFILGSDALIDLPKWHRWEQLVNYAHIMIIPRAGFDWQEKCVPTFKKWINRRYKENLAELGNAPSGYIVEAPLSPMTLSSTAIRKGIKENKISSNEIPQEVMNYIKIHDLYRIC